MSCSTLKWKISTFLISVNFRVLPLPSRDRTLIAIYNFKDIVKYFQDEKETKVELRGMEEVQTMQEFPEFLLMRSPCERRDDSEEKIQ